MKNSHDLDVRLADTLAGRKTQIAIEYCYRFLNDCPKGNIFWAHAGTLSNFVEACKTIAGEL